MRDIYVAFDYRGLSMGITIQSFDVGDSNEVEIGDYEISLDYCIDDKQHPFDSIALMINDMLSDGRHLQEKIFDCISPEDMERIEETCRKEWRDYWDDFTRDHGVRFEDQNLT